MKIKSPLVHRKEVKPLCEAGADELFCGLEPYLWRRKYRDFSINQRQSAANFTKLADLKKAVSIAHSYKTRVHVAVNAFFYLQKQYETLERIIRDVWAIGADGLILADPILLLNLDRNLLKGKDIVVGCDATIFNSAAVKFYKELGATRVVFPRAMTTFETEEVAVQDASIEYEVFIIHDLCFFEDGFCTYCKEQAGEVKKEARARRGAYFFTASRLPLRGFGGGCRARFRKQRVSLKNRKPLGVIKPFSFWGKKHIEGCGACSIYDFNRMNITSLKVLDRNLPTEGKIQATRFIRECLDLLRGGPFKEEYIKKCKSLFKKYFKVRCNQYDCYYPI